MLFTRRTVLSFFLAATPALAGRAEAKRAAKQARKRAKRTKELARQDVSDRKASAKQRDQDRYELNAGNAELDKARRQDLVDLTTRRQSHTTRVVMETPQAEEPKPGVRTVTRGVESAPEPKKK